jgi:hypothetical protein
MGLPFEKAAEKIIYGDNYVKSFNSRIKSRLKIRAILRNDLSWCMLDGSENHEEIE